MGHLQLCEARRRFVQYCVSDVLVYQVHHCTRHRIFGVVGRKYLCLDYHGRDTTVELITLYLSKNWTENHFVDEETTINSTSDHIAKTTRFGKIILDNSMVPTTTNSCESEQGSEPYCETIIEQPWPWAAIKKNQCCAHRKVISTPFFLSGP